MTRDPANDPEALTGLWVHSADLPLLEATLLATELDYFVVDAEHTAFAHDELVSLAIVGERHGVRPFLRVEGPRDGSQIGRALDLGYSGIIVPHVDSAADARSAVLATRYPPDGNRGWGAKRATKYGRIAPNAYQRSTLTNPTELWCLLESTAGIAVAADIAKTEGVSGLLIGPMDLSASLGVLGKVDHDEVWAAISHTAHVAADVGLDFGVAWGAPSQEQIRRAARLGSTIYSLGTQDRLLRQGLTAAAERLHTAID